MKNSIHYTSEHPTKFNELLALYESLGWNSLKLTVNELEQMCKQSWYAIYAFKEEQLIGMGRVISDGVITGVICGVCVMPSISILVLKRHSETINPSLRTKQGYSATYVCGKIAILL